MFIRHHESFIQSLFFAVFSLSFIRFFPFTIEPVSTFSYILNDLRYSIRPSIPALQDEGAADSEPRAPGGAGHRDPYG